MKFGPSGPEVDTILTFGATSKSGLVRVDVSTMSMPLAYFSSQLVQAVKKYLTHMKHVEDNADKVVITYRRIQFGETETAYVHTEDGGLEICTLTIVFQPTGSALYHFIPVGLHEHDVCVTLSGFTNIPFGLQGVAPIGDVLSIRRVISSALITLPADATLLSRALDAFAHESEYEATRSMLMACVNAHNERIGAQTHKTVCIYLNVISYKLRLSLLATEPLPRSGIEYANLLDEVFRSVPHAKLYMVEGKALQTLPTFVPSLQQIVFVFGRDGVGRGGGGAGSAAGGL